jgi:DNA replication protein DnaC
MNKKPNIRESLAILLRALKLPTFLAMYAEAAELAEKKGWGVEEYLHQLAFHELQERKKRRIERNLKKANFPEGKALATLKPDKFPLKIRKQLPMLCEGGFVDRAENVLAFGLPGRGKTHLLCAIGQELVQRGFTALFTPAYQLVQRLLSAKKELLLEQALQRLDRYDVVLVDDIGYIQQDREEMEVLFTFLSQRYERRSVMITSNLVFSQWDRIFKDPMTTAAAIDRVIHHSIILELTGPSIRNEEAAENNMLGKETEEKEEQNACESDSSMGQG